MECSNHPRDNREEGHAPSPAPNRYNWEKQRKSVLADGKSNGRSRNNDKPRTSGENPQRTETGRQHHQQLTQGRNNQNSFSLQRL